MSEFIFDDEIKAINALDLPQQAVLFDVGCSYGEYTLEVAKKMNGQPFTVHAFEPAQRLCDIQKERFKKVPNLRFYINNLAVSDHEGDAAFIRINAPGNQAAEGCSSLFYRKIFIENPSWKSAIVPMVTKLITLDKYIADNNIKHINLMKVDVEGAELFVFRGAEDMFKHELVDIIQFEYNDAWKDSGAKMFDVIDFVDDYGYALADFINGKFIKLTEFVEDYGHHNYYLISSSYFDTL